jgi:hypothetical protein
MPGSQAAAFSRRDLSPRHGSLGLVHLRSRVGVSSSMPSGGVKIAGSKSGALAGGGAEEPLSRLAAEAGVGLGSAGLCTASTGFHSQVVRLAIQIAEELDKGRIGEADGPSAASCRACVAILEQIATLLGPMAPIVRRVHAALHLCLLSTAADVETMQRALAEREDEQVRRRGATPRAARLPPREGAPYFVLAQQLRDELASSEAERGRAFAEIEDVDALLQEQESELSEALAELESCRAAAEAEAHEHAALEAELQLLLLNRNESHAPSSESDRNSESGRGHDG